MEVLSSPPNIKITVAAPEGEIPKRRVSIVEVNDTVRADSPKGKGILHALSPFVENASYATKDGNCLGKKENGDAAPGGLYKTCSYSSSENQYPAGRKDDGRSWWYKFCVKCRGEDESIPSWEPQAWPRFCPYPFFPTYRQFSRVVCLVLIGFLSWCAIYSIVGETAAPPHGKLFQLIFLSICAYLGGCLTSLTTLPALIGMLFTGLLLQNVGIVNLDDSFAEVANKIRHGALVIILIRAGLDLDPKALWRLKFIVVRLSLIPWIVEGGVCAISSRFFLGMAWDFSILLGSIIAAVAPAVVVPCLFRLRTKGYGVAKGIPTLIIAVASIDDATSIAVFGIIKSIMFVHSSVTSLILQGPVSIFGGFGFGVLFGLLLRYAPERNDKFVVPFRIIMLLAAGMAAIYFSEHLGYGGAGPLGAVVAAFVSLVFWTKQGWDIEDNPASTAFEIFWMIVEPVLFGITGAQMRFEELHGTVVLIGIGILLLGVVIRIFTTLITGIGCSLNLKEKLFCALAWMPKATVQAALAPIVLAHVSDTTSKEYGYAKKIITLCILSIMITTTIGAALVSLLGSRLLRKTRFAVEPEQWRRSHRPSVRDISIIEEDEEVDEDSEAQAHNEVVEIATMDNNEAQADESSAKAPMEKDVEDTLTMKLRNAETVMGPQKSLGSNEETIKGVAQDK
ncbi:sodium/hydrogen exchanger 9B2 isoform X1 [Dendroctonus ponderosae]|uniref:Cation/H+ exchanger transmembrane domain-containing protein n=1 Tax=Dendroctonus ponderosae TaxID=77166 RepID=A0AAR5P7Y0_DENPD|nr:sodium/hydrogen exchanger 9B2 isoform X1 [Dendroctonus ponderosae]